MPRAYRQRSRATAYETTRHRILDAATASIAKGEFGLREIADRASVTVQTVYAHFGSKAGLIAAIVQEASAREGLVAGLARVWKRESARDALDEMVKVTFDFWRRAWPLIGFTLTALRADPDFAALVRGVDDARLADLLKICERLVLSGDLRPGLRASAAATGADPSRRDPHRRRGIGVFVGQPALVLGLGGWVAFIVWTALTSLSLIHETAPRAATTATRPAPAY